MLSGIHEPWYSHEVLPRFGRLHGPSYVACAASDRRGSVHDVSGRAAGGTLPTLSSAVVSA